MKRLALLVAAIMTLALLNVVSLQATSRDFLNSNLCAGPPTPAENVPAGAGGAMRLIVKYNPVDRGTPPVTLDTGDPANINLSGCDIGEEVTRKNAAGICTVCSSIGTVVFSGTAVPFNCATDLSNAANVSFDCLVSGVARLKVDNNPIGGTPALEVNPKNNSTKLMSFTHSSTAGNDVFSDLLPDLQVQITPGGDDGVVTFRVEMVAGGGPSFTVNTTSKKAPQIHQEIAAGFTAMGYTGVKFGDISNQAQHPALFVGPSVRVPNIHTLNGNPVRGVSIIGVPPSATTPITRMLVEVENSEPVPPGFPAVSEWTIALFIGLVLLMGTWLLRRRLPAQAI